MKHLKKLSCLLLALVMVFGLAVTAFAAENTGGYTLTINGTTAGKKYDLYKIFDLKQSDDLTAYSYTVNSNFTSYFTSKNIADPVDYVSELTKDSEELSKLAQDLLAYAVQNNITYKSVTGTASNTTVTGMELGYYLLNPLGASAASGSYATMFALNTLDKQNNQTITVKAVYPTIDKVIDDSQGGVKADDAAIGDEVTFKLTTSVPDMTGYDKYYFVVTDTLSEGLTYNTSSVEIKIDNTLLDTKKYTVKADTDANTGKTTLEIVFNDFISQKDNAGKGIVITYKATLNEKAVTGTAEGNPNKVILTYSNDPKVKNDPGTTDNPDKPTPTSPVGTTPESTTTTYTTDLTINKVDQDNKPLAGAKFKLTGTSLNQAVVTKETFTKSASGTYWLLKNGTYTTTAPTQTGDEDDNTNLYTSVTEKYEKTTTTTLETASSTDSTKEIEQTVNADGTLKFEGLKAGTYTLVETEAPEGYNKLKESIEITIGFTVDNDGQNPVFTCKYRDNNDQTPTEQTATNGTITIKNYTGSLLPSTGGMGTTLFYILGSVLAVGALVILVTKRRMNAR